MDSSHSTLPQRFLTKFSVDPETMCWDWVASTNHGGYGQYWHGDTLKRAHRFAYEWIIGPIPADLTIDHLCKNVACVNPAHLEPVTVKENILRGTQPSAVNARKTHCTRGHEFTPENTYRRGPHKTWRGCRICIADYNVAYRQKA